MLKSETTQHITSTSHTTRSNPYATRGPADGTGRDWHQWAKDVQAQKTTELQVEEDIDTEPQVIVPAREAALNIYGGTPIEKLRTLAVKNGWETRVGYSKSFKQGRTIKSGENAGQSHPDATREQLWLLARKQGKGTITITYIRMNGAEKWTRDHGVIRGVMHNYKDTEMKEYIKS